MPSAGSMFLGESDFSFPVLQRLVEWTNSGCDRKPKMRSERSREGGRPNTGLPAPQPAPKCEHQASQARAPCPWGLPRCQAYDPGQGCHPAKTPAEAMSCFSLPSFLSVLSLSLFFSFSCFLLFIPSAFCPSFALLLRFLSLSPQGQPNCCPFWFPRVRLRGGSRLSGRGGSGP